MERGAGRTGSSADSLPEEDEDDEGPGGGNGRRGSASSLVSGLLIELYSAAEPSARSRALRELRRRPSPLRYLRLKDMVLNHLTWYHKLGVPDEQRVLTQCQQCKIQDSLTSAPPALPCDVGELTTIKRELNYQISVQSAKLLRLLKQKDRLVHKVQKNCDIVTACLQAVSQKRRSTPKLLGFVE